MNLYFLWRGDFLSWVCIMHEIVCDYKICIAIFWLLQLTPLHIYKFSTVICIFQTNMKTYPWTFFFFYKMIQFFYSWRGVCVCYFSLSKNDPQSLFHWGHYSLLRWMKTGWLIWPDKGHYYANQIHKRLIMLYQITYYYTKTIVIWSLRTGVIIPHTPIGCFKTSKRRFFALVGIMSPYTRFASSAYSSKKPIP